MKWKPIDTLRMGHVVLLYSEKWVDLDFNPTGVREGFRDEDNQGPIVSARWNGCHDCWDTDVGYEATHWTERPGPPTK